MTNKEISFLSIFIAIFFMFNYSFLILNLSLTKSFKITSFFCIITGIALILFFSWYKFVNLFESLNRVHSFLLALFILFLCSSFTYAVFTKPNSVRHFFDGLFGIFFTTATWFFS
jgi:hypothetical protein